MQGRLLGFWSLTKIAWHYPFDTTVTSSSWIPTPSLDTSLKTPDRFLRELFAMAVPPKRDFRSRLTWSLQMRWEWYLRVLPEKSHVSDFIRFAVHQRQTDSIQWEEQLRINNFKITALSKKNNNNKTNKKWFKSASIANFKDGAYYCYCAYVLRISRYSDFLSVMLTNTGIFLRGLKLSGESRS